MGALAKELGGKEWLEMLHGVLHPDGDRFSFEWDWLAPSGLHVKDFICPSSFRFGEARRFQMGGKFGAVSFLQITATEMNDRLLADLLDTDSTILVSLHIRSMDQNEAIKTVKRKITDLDSMKIDAQKRAAREGFDMDIIPSDLATYAGEAKNILRDLQSRNERMFLLTFLVVNIADTKQKLDNDVFRASSVAQKYNCQLTRLDFQQEQGLVSALPLGVNQIKIQRGLTTSSVSIFVPFISQELFQGGEALYYGLNATSGNMILADRKQLKTPNGLILGTPGSGKSFSAKREILNVLHTALAGDKMHPKVQDITVLNLVEITRKKSRQNLSSVLYAPCPVCDGSGRVQSRETLALEVKRRLRVLLKQRGSAKSLLVVANPWLAQWLLAKDIRAWERELACALKVESDASLHVESFMILDNTGVDK